MQKDTTSFSARLKNLSNKVEAWTGVLDKIPAGVIDRQQIDKNLKGMIQNIEKTIKETVKAYSEMPKRVSLKVKTLDNFKGDLPRYESEWASGFDVRAQVEETITVEPGHRVLVPTGLSFAIPKGYEIQVRPRSGLAIKSGVSMVNTPGTIDADYRGECKVILINHGQAPFMIEDQDRIAQFVVCPVVQADFVQVESLDETNRGAGGFGSTGKTVTKTKIETEIDLSDLKDEA